MEISMQVDDHTTYGLNDLSLYFWHSWVGGGSSLSFKTESVLLL